MKSTTFFINLIHKLLDNACILFLQECIAIEEKCQHVGNFLQPKINTLSAVPNDLFSSDLIQQTSSSSTCSWLASSSPRTASVPCGRVLLELSPVKYSPKPLASGVDRES
jgi:hypothetical protein